MICHSARRQQAVTPWDYGHVQPPLKAYFESNEGKEMVANKPTDARALVPGCGRVRLSDVFP